MAPICGFGEIRTLSFWRCLLSELLGTLFLVMFAVGSGTNSAGVLQVAFGAGIGVALMVWCFGHISGCHINPAVTIGFLTTRKIGITRGVCYVISQCVGATAGAGLVQLMTQRDDTTPGNASLTVSGPDFHGNVTAMQAVSIENFITFILVLTVFATCDSKRPQLKCFGPFAIGLSVFLGHLWAKQLTGAATNPAAAFGTALVSGYWRSHWVYWLGPLSGGAQAALVYDLLLAVNAGKQKLIAFFTDSDYDGESFDDEGQKVELVKNSRLNDTNDSKEGSTKV